MKNLYIVAAEAIVYSGIAEGSRIPLHPGDTPQSKLRSVKRLIRKAVEFGTPIESIMGAASPMLRSVITLLGDDDGMANHADILGAAYVMKMLGLLRTSVFGGRLAGALADLNVSDIIERVGGVPDPMYGVSLDDDRTMAGLYQSCYAGIMTFGQAVKVVRAVTGVPGYEDYLQYAGKVYDQVGDRIFANQIVRAAFPEDYGVLLETRQSGNEVIVDIERDGVVYAGGMMYVDPELASYVQGSNTLGDNILSAFSRNSADARSGAIYPMVSVSGRHTRMTGIEGLIKNTSRVILSLSKETMVQVSLSNYGNSSPGYFHPGYNGSRIVSVRGSGELSTMQTMAKLADLSTAIEENQSPFDLVMIFVGGVPNSMHQFRVGDTPVIIGGYSERCPSVSGDGLCVFIGDAAKNPLFLHTVARHFCFE